ncbi:GNAT family N-acetyltransferase [Spirosoma flavus]
MHTELQTSRLTMRPVQQTDFDILQTILTDRFVRRYLCDDQILPPDEIQEFISTSEQTFDEGDYGLWLLHEQLKNMVIGFAGLWSFFEETQPQLLYALLPAFTREGYATEASKAVIDYCFNKLSFPYIDASFDEPNIASLRVAERLEMTFLKKEWINESPVLFYRKVNSAVA